MIGWSIVITLTIILPLIAGGCTFYLLRLCARVYPPSPPITKGMLLCQDIGAAALAAFTFAGLGALIVLT